MAKLKIGADIKNYGDVRNLIIELINHSNEFEQDFIIKLTSNYLKGSELKISKKEIYLIVDEILDLMQRKNVIVFNNGIYSTTSISYTLKDYYNQKLENSLVL